MVVVTALSGVVDARAHVGKHHLRSVAKALRQRVVSILYVGGVLLWRGAQDVGALQYPLTRLMNELLDRVSAEGGLYGEQPSLKPDNQLEGDMHFNNDFRGTYAELLEDWLSVDAPPIVNGNFEKLNFLRQ